MDRRSTDQQVNDIQIPDIGQILAIIMKRKLLALFLILIPVTLTALYLKTKPSVYQATTSVILETQNINMPDFQDILSAVKFDNLTVPTQVEVILSPNLARKTINALSLDINKKDQLILPAYKGAPKGTLSSLEKNTRIDANSTKYNVIKEFFNNLHVSQQGTSRIIEMSFDAHDPQHAAKIINTHAQHYIASQIASKREKTQKFNNWISGQIVTLQEEIKKKSHAVQQFKSDSGMVQGLNSEDLIYEQISEISKQLGIISAKELDFQARVELLNKGQASSIKEVIDSELIQSLKSRSSIATQHLQSLRADFGNNHPNVVSAKKEAEQINNDIDREISNIRRSIKNELIAVSKQKTLLKQRMEDLQTGADTFQERKITLQALQREEAASRKLLENFFTRSEEIKSQVDLDRQDVRIISPASIPGEPKGSKKLIILLAVTILATIAALGIIFLLETIDKGIQDKDDIKKLLKLKLLGTLPQEKSPLSRILDKNRSSYVEEIKRIYIHLSAIENAQTLLFTSSRTGEGKSVSAVSLAYYLHSIGKNVVIIDANTLTPQISTITNVKTSPGFYELLAGTHDLEHVISKNEIGLSVISAGEDSAFSSDLLVAGRFKEQISKLKKAFDYIIIDCACALEASDAEVLSGLVDQTILIAAWARTPKKELRKVADNLREFSHNTPCVVLNKIPKKELKKSRR